MLQFRVVGLDGSESFVQRLADVFSTGNQFVPARADREAAPFVLNFFLGFLAGQALFLHQLSDAFFEYVVEPLQKQQAENVVLEVR